MLANEGQVEAAAAERGVRGKSVARMLIMNKANFGMSQAMRTRGLTQARWQAKNVSSDVHRQLKGALNRSFSKVAVQPVADMAPPPPVMENVGLTLMLGMGQALGAGLAGKANQGDALKDKAPKPPKPDTQQTSFNWNSGYVPQTGTGLQDYSYSFNPFG